MIEVRSVRSLITLACNLDIGFYRIKINKYMAKTKVQKKRHMRWLKKHPDYVIKRLKNWISKEKDPIELAKAKDILKRHLIENKTD